MNDPAALQSLDLFGAGELSPNGLQQPAHHCCRDAVPEFQHGEKHEAAQSHLHHPNLALGPTILPKLYENGFELHKQQLNQLLHLRRELSKHAPFLYSPSA